MTAQPADVYEMLQKVRYDLTAAQAKLTDAFNILRELNLPQQPTTDCPTCGLKFRGPLTLAEHLHISHDGPIPEHWLLAEARAVEPDAEKTRASADDEEPDLG
jgi:hypothetical protein